MGHEMCFNFLYNIFHAYVLDFNRNWIVSKNLIQILQYEIYWKYIWQFLSCFICIIRCIDRVVLLRTPQRYEHV